MEHHWNWTPRPGLPGLSQLKELLTHPPETPFLAAIDGRCGSGKTTLASVLAEETGCAVLHLDHFFLRPEQRTPQRLAAPGGNVDAERFVEEVLRPLAAGKDVTYRPFDCAVGALGEEIRVSRRAVYLVEGSYSLHPLLTLFYHCRIFLSVGEEEQLRRLRLRAPEKLEAFRSRWIPLEEKYFAAFHLPEGCDFCFDTDRTDGEK